MLCAVCKRPLLEGMTTCVLCGGPAAVDDAPPAPLPAPAAPAAPFTPGGQDAYAPAPTPAPMQLQVPAPMMVHHAYVPPAMYSTPTDNPFAIVSLICGILGLTPFWIGFVLSVIAIIFGAIGLARASRIPDGRGRGLAIAGLVLGAVFIWPASCGI